MGNRTAVVVALIFVILFGYDIVENNSQVTVFLARKGTDLIEWIAFWR